MTVSSGAAPLVCLCGEAACIKLFFLAHNLLYKQALGLDEPFALFERAAECLKWARFSLWSGEIFEGIRAAVFGQRHHTNGISLRWDASLFSID